MRYLGNVLLSLSFSSDRRDLTAMVLLWCTIPGISSGFGHTSLMDVRTQIFNLELINSDTVLDRFLDTRK